MLYHTENETTTQIGQCLATVICDSTSNGRRITTLELVYPRFIHSELMTHRVFSRNASSSRATPLKVLLDEVENDPTFFDAVGKNRAGMVAGALLSENELKGFQQEWSELGAMVADKIMGMSERYNVHKQVLNRALEPWSRIRTLVTSTEFENFFRLRLAPDVQPEMRSLALAMKTAMLQSDPRSVKYHVPYVHDYDGTQITSEIIAQSVARCARVSYARHDRKDTTPEEDEALYDRLLSSGHMSPFEHVACSSEYKDRFKNFDNFVGWKSWRHCHLDGIGSFA